MNIKFIKLIFCSTCLLVLLFPFSAQAVNVRFYPAQSLSQQDKTFSSTILVDTKGESINTFSGVIAVNPALAKGLQVSDSGSIITYWVTRPTFDSQKNTISFSGAVPGGFTGDSGILFSLIFAPISSTDQANAVTIPEFKAYKNDGLASIANVSVGTFSLGNQTSPTNPEVNEQLFLDSGKKDNVPPEIFSPQIFREASVENGKWFVSFATQDKQSGIDHYEVQESLTGEIDSGSWHRAENPYLLEDQGLHSFVYIVAVDRQGNERIIKVFPRNPLAWYQLYAKELLVFVGIVICIIFIKLFRRYTKKPSENYKNIVK